jgi:RHS repeat-associated protein
LLSATTRYGIETFSFDPASNLLDEKNAEVRRPLDQAPLRSRRLDNLLREYAGTHYEYDGRGNQIQRWKNGSRCRMRWDLFDRLVHFEDARLSVEFAYDALGRRIQKHSQAHHQARPEAGSQWNRNEHARIQREIGCGFTLYGWDGDNLAWESSPGQIDGNIGRTVHYVYEPGSHVPVVQAHRNAAIVLSGLPENRGEYNVDDDPLWVYSPNVLPIDGLAWYQCDHLGTPLELTDQNGEIAWSGQYKAWGEIQEQRLVSAQQHGLTNPFRFQGQYHDHETGLHYNRYRYYDPAVGRFLSKDPIGFNGGLNLYQYAPNPIEWVDPLGLAKKKGPWTSPGGLVYESGSVDGHRKKHVLAHEKVDTTKPKHSVFKCKTGESLAIVDEAWGKRGAATPSGNKDVYHANMGRVVGTQGETKVRIVTKHNTNKVITAFPVK